MLKFHELAPSPNNVKVRLALRYKGIPFEAVAVDPSDRSSLVAVTGQELSPVIEDRGIVLNDSEAILHYVDANYRDTPRLWPAGRDDRKRCEAWHRTLDERVARPWLPIFFYAIRRAEALDPEAVDRFSDSLAWLEEELGDRDSFLGPEMPIGDLRVAEWAVYAMPGEALVSRVRLFAKIKELFAVPEDRFPRLRAFLAPWNELLG